MNPATHKLWSTSDVSRFLGCCERQVYILRDQGMPTIRVGKKVRFDPERVKAWVLSRKEGTTDISPPQELNVRLKVTASFLVTLGLYDGGVDQTAIADNINDLLREAGGVRDYIDRVEIHEVADDKGHTLVSSTDA